MANEKLVFITYINVHEYIARATIASLFALNLAKIMPEKVHKNIGTKACSRPQMNDTAILYFIFFLI